MQNKITLGAVSIAVLLSWACASKPNKSAEDSKTVAVSGDTTKAASTVTSASKESAPVPPTISTPDKKEVLQNKLEAHTCKNGVETRTLWVEKIVPNGCKLWYSNYKKTGPAAWSANGQEHCLKVQRQIIGNLGVGSFTCVQN